MATVDPPNSNPHARDRNSRAPNAIYDGVAKVVVMLAAFLIVVLLASIFVVLAKDSRLALETFGAGFLVTHDWDPVQGSFGALSSIVGTVISALIAMVIAVPLSLGIALFLVEVAPPWLATVVGGAIELLAAIPSIIYGMWGLFVFAPFLATHVEPLLKRLFGDVPLIRSLFSGPPIGIGMLNAGLVLALMILPFITAISRDVFRAVPAVLREAAYGMGATTWEMARSVTLRYGRKGLVGAAFLGLGRALGETMAVTFVIGNSHDIVVSLFAPSNTISSTLANEFNEASGPLHISALISLGLVLLGITVFFQALAQFWLGRSLKAGGHGQ